MGKIIFKRPKKEPTVLTAIPTENNSVVLSPAQMVEIEKKEYELKNKFVDLAGKFVDLGGQIVSYLKEKEKTIQTLAECEKEKVKAIEETKRVYLQCSARIQESQDSLKKTLSELENAEKDSQRNHEARMRKLDAIIGDFLERGKQLREYSEMMKNAALENNDELFEKIKILRDAEVELYKLSQQLLG